MLAAFEIVSAEAVSEADSGYGGTAGIRKTRALFVLATRRADIPFDTDQLRTHNQPNRNQPLTVLNMRTRLWLGAALLIALVVPGSRSAFAYPTRKVFDTHLATGVQFFLDSSYSLERGQRTVYWSPLIEIQKNPDGSIQCFERLTEKGVELTLTVKLVRPDRALNWARRKHPQEQFQQLPINGLDLLIDGTPQTLEDWNSQRDISYLEIPYKMVLVLETDDARAFEKQAFEHSIKLRAAFLGSQLRGDVTITWNVQKLLSLLQTSIGIGRVFKLAELKAKLFESSTEWEFRINVTAAQGDQEKLRQAALDTFFAKLWPQFSSPASAQETKAEKENSVQSETKETTSEKAVAPLARPSVFLSPGKNNQS